MIIVDALDVIIRRLFQSEYAFEPDIPQARLAAASSRNWQPHSATAGPSPLISRIFPDEIQITAQNIGENSDKFVESNKKIDARDQETRLESAAHCVTLLSLITTRE
jgi:hypothetical protein